MFLQILFLIVLSRNNSLNLIIEYFIMPNLNKIKNEKKPEKESSPTLRERWRKGGGSADIRMTTKLLEDICDKIQLK